MYFMLNSLCAELLFGLIGGKSRKFFEERKAKWLVRVLSLCIFVAVFAEVREYFSYISIGIGLVYRCTWWASVASCGLFLSSFDWFRRYWLVGFPIYLPTIPGALSLAPNDSCFVFLLVLVLVYPCFVFFGLKKGKQ